MYSDNRWDLVTAGRVYPKPKPTLAESFETVLAALVRAKLEPKAHFARNRNRRATGNVPGEPLVKPAAYKARNESNGSGPSGLRG